MNGLKVFRLHHVGIDSRVSVESSGYISHHVLDEFRIIVGLLGDELFVGTLE
jgi:hypothetical protein